MRETKSESGGNIKLRGRKWTESGWKDPSTRNIVCAQMWRQKAEKTFLVVLILVRSVVSLTHFQDLMRRARALS